MSTLPPTFSERQFEKRRLVMMAAGCSALFGFASLVLRAFISIPAIILGFVSLRQINESDGQIPGRWAAISGMILGLIGFVIDVIGIVAIILLHASHSADKATSQNNLRQIGQANLFHHRIQEHYPIGTLFPPAQLIERIPWQHYPYEKRLAWSVSLLPYFGLKRNANAGPLKPSFSSPTGKLYADFDLLGSWDAKSNYNAIRAPIRLYLSPGHPSFDPSSKPRQTHYVGFAGVGPDAATLPVEDVRIGMFGYDRLIRQSDVTDGLRYTSLMIETAERNGIWAAGGRATIREVDENRDDLLGKGKPFGGCFPNGAHLLMVDGSVRFITNEMPASIFRRHVTIRE